MFGPRITLFELFSFKVRIDLSWLLLAGLIAWGLAGGYFPAVAPGFDEATYWAMGVVGFLGLAASIVAHELAHALVGRRYGMSIRGITLFLFGGIAEMEEEPSHPRGEALMALAGPAMSLGLALLCLGLGLAAAHLQVPPLAPVLFYLAFINGLLAGFNLVPAFPLDGGRVLRAVLWSRTGDLAWATAVAGRLGGWLGLLLMAAGVWQIVTDSAVAGAWWVLIGLFLRAAAGAAVHQQRQRLAFAGERVRQFMESHPLTVGPEVRLDRLVADYFESYALACFPVVAEQRLLGRVCLAAVRKIPADAWPAYTVAQAMEPCPAEAMVAEDAEAAVAFRRMRTLGRRHLLVMRGDRLVGLVRQVSLLNFLAASRRASRAVRPANDDTPPRRRAGE